MSCGDTVTSLDDNVFESRKETIVVLQPLGPVQLALHPLFHCLQIVIINHATGTGQTLFLPFLTALSQKIYG